ncbi:MAG: glycoside hydrolase family 97 protein [Bryobacteraceae bacterium]|jgi:alpha-glucosidase
MRNLVVMSILTVVAAAAQSAAISPSGALEMSVTADGGQLAYTVNFRGKPVVVRSTLGLELARQPVLGAHVRIVHATAGTGDETYPLLHGKASTVHSVYHSLTLDLEETGAPHRKLQLEARAFDDGVAFRYVVPKQAGLDEIHLATERTTFRLAKDGATYPLLLDGFQTPYEDAYVTLPLSAIHPKELIGLPFLAEVPGTAWVAITEADIDNYAGMYLEHNSPDALQLSSRLSPSVEDKDLAVVVPAPMATPWRVLLIGDQPGRLVESNIVTSLNPPSTIADTSWIKPGKTAWDWWNGTWAEGVDFTPGMNTATMKHYIDFCASSGFPYLLIDAGWAYQGDGPNSSHADLTRTSPNIDMPAILDYGKTKNVRIWLWAHWTDINRQIDEAFPLFEKWGIAGVKIDFMNRDDQWMVGFYHRVLQTAAAHHLMIDFHGAYKPDGIDRTWPNQMTREGVMGLEYSKWSGRITPEHNLMLAFTRALAGPMDYTPGGFDNVTRAEFVPRNKKPMVMGTRAHELALYVVFESGFQMVSDYPEAYKGQKDFEFIRAVPNAWDETKVVSGRPNEFIAVARRKGKEWYLGAITGWHGAEVDLPLEFLGHGNYAAEIYADASDAGDHPKHTAISGQPVNPATVMHLKLASGGGAAIRFRAE